MNMLAVRLASTRIAPEAIKQFVAEVEEENESKSYAIGCGILSGVVVVIVTAASRGDVDSAIQGGAIIGVILGALAGVAAPNTDGQAKFFAALLLGSLFGTGGAILSALVAAIVH